MARDYAQRGGGNRRQATTRGSKRSAAGLPGWVWLAAGLSIGLAIAAFVYIARPPAGPMVAADATVAKAAAKPGKKKDGPIPLPPKEKPRFTFYEILRDQEVILPDEQSHSATPPGALPEGAAGDGSYIIQVASFRGEADAERQKANLALIGIESRIESVTIDGKDTYYRVRVGPDNSWNRVQNMMARLEENGIEGMLIKLK